MAGFLDSTVETDFTALGSPHNVQTLDFLKKVLKGIRYANLGVAGRVVTGQVKNGDGTDYQAVVSINIQCDEIITVNTGTLVTTGNSSIQVNTNASGVFQVTIAGTQGATVMTTVSGGVTNTVLVGSGGTGGGGSGGGGGGGYQGKYDAAWPGTTFPAGSIIRRGPFAFGTTSSTNSSPCDVSNVGSPSDWTVSNSGGGHAQSGNILQLTNGALNQASAAYRTVTMSTWDQKRIISDALTGANGQATGIFFGVYDAALATTPTSFDGVPGFWGVFIDNWNNGSGSAVQTVINGTRGNTVTVPTTGQISGNEILETTRFYRYYVDMVESGANWILTVWRDSWDLNTAAGINAPGFIATWTVTKPTFTTCRAAVAAYTGGIVGTHRVRSFYVLDRSSPWEMISMFPHAPRIDTSVF